MAKSGTWFSRRLELSPVVSDSPEVRSALEAWRSRESNAQFRNIPADFTFGRLHLKDVVLDMVTFSSPTSVVLGNRVWGTLRIAYSYLEPKPSSTPTPD